MAAGKEKHGDRAHAVLSPSGADRWLNCTPSARMGEKYPDEESDYAREGTLAHEIAEITLLHRVGLRNKSTHDARLKVLQKSPLYYDGMIQDIEPYVTTIQEQLSTAKDSELHVEVKVDYSEYVEDGSGLVDSAVIAKRILYITDLKFGQGVRVSAIDNSQLKLYGLGALMQFEMTHEIDLVRLTIVQPRIDNISVWDITPEALYKWAAKEVKPRAAIAFKGEGKQVPGDWCKFCKVKPHCKALKEEALIIAQTDFSEQSIEKAEEDDLLVIYNVSARITDYLEAVKAHVFKRALEGKKWEGLKLVEGKSNRSITDEKMAGHVLITKGFKFSDFENSKLKGIGDLEKLLGGKAALEKTLGKYITKPPGKPTLVDADDPRPEFTTANDFKDEEEDEDDFLK